MNPNTSTRFSLPSIAGWLGYCNAIVVALSVLGFLSIYGTYYFPVLVIFIPFVVLFPWALTGGWIVAICQLIYFLCSYFLMEPKPPSLKHHLVGVLLCASGYLTFYIGLLNGWTVTV